jgi:endonuclease/exonuclease/phosphatase family metal-dependent hydrolase
VHRRTLRIVTYNIHRCRGMDGRTLPWRTIEVLSSLKADIIALQEVIGAGPDDSGHAAEIGAALGMGWVMASVRHLRGHQFGNLVLSHFPIRQHGMTRMAHVVSRAAASAPTSSWTTKCCTSSTCISAPPIASGRIRPSGLAAIMHDGRTDPPKILLGDFNEWSGGLATRC